MRVYEMHFPHVCPVCGEDFLGTKTQRYCSKACRYKEEARLAREKREKSSANAERARRVEEQRRMKERLMARDAEYAAAFPDQASGAVRGRLSFGGKFLSSIRTWRSGEIVGRWIAR